MRAIVLLIIGVAASLVSSCGLLPTGCAGVGAPNVEITVIDSLTGAAAAAGATLLTYDLEHGGARVDSVTGRTDTEVLWGSIDRTGRFSVFVRKDGYRDWSKQDVTVRNGCPAIQTARFTARLARP
jgi:predicted lipoprotein with Yx(FWY)xxD motif